MTFFSLSFSHRSPTLSQGEKTHIKTVFLCAIRPSWPSYCPEWYNGTVILHRKRGSALWGCCCNIWQSCIFLRVATNSE
ncbi:hypothetical protein ACRALDRAFT_1075333 [Sodiomyces alcalophilus JCM 7366]|uniref:uncharacterized protein n=1 Tax=Sodiomyces alcalophilus JCM 7366 TaxID=591952 RepID=UPI0039B5B4B8